MHVLLFRMLCDTGGVSSSMQLLGAEMTRRGVEHEYWFCRPSARLSEFLAMGRTTVGTLAQLADRLARGDVDVVQMTASDPAAEVVAMLARAVAPRTRVVVTARGALATGWTRQTCFAYTAISQGMADVNQPYTDVEIEVVRNAIDVARYAPPAALDGAAGAPIVAFVGRTTAIEKDFPRFTRIARRLIDAVGARVWVADPHGAQWEKFGALPVERIPTERWGGVPHAEMPAFYRAVAASNGVVLITSRTEGFGNVAPEAAACGARVAAPNVMGLREAVVDGETGMLFPRDASDDDVAARIGAWLAAPHDMTACAAAAREAFSPSRMMDAYLAIWTRAGQRVVRAVPPRATAETVPELAVLLDHLEKQRGWRADTAADAATQLLAGGRVRAAAGALGIALQAAPRRALRRAGSGVVRPLLSTARRIVRPARIGA